MMELLIALIILLAITILWTQARVAKLEWWEERKADKGNPTTVREVVEDGDEWKHQGDDDV